LRRILDLAFVIAIAAMALAPCAAAEMPANPEVKLDAQLSADGPVFSFIPGKAYRLALTLTNGTKDELALVSFGVSAREPQGMAVEAKLDGTAPTKAAAGGTAVVNFALVFPKEAAGKIVTLSGDVSYGIGEKQYAATCKTGVSVTPEFEITLLPSRLVLNPKDGEKRVGMSVINHAEAPFEGKVSLTASPGLTLTPAEFSTKIDSYGLEAFVFGVKADPAIAAGHYAVFVDVGGKGKDWGAIDVPVVAKKAKVEINGNLDDWKDAARFSIAKLMSVSGDKAEYKPVGKGWIAYDDSALYMAFEIEDAKHVTATPPESMAAGDSIRVAFDTLLNGAKTASGGYKDDDYEYIFGSAEQGLKVLRSQAAGSRPTGPVTTITCAVQTEGGKAVYEMAWPWAELDPLKPAKDKTFAVSVLISQDDGAGVSQVEWGGGMTPSKDPRRFVPVILAE